MKKRYIFIISALLAHALLTGCWQSQINKNFLVVDDLCQPVKDAHIYILRKEPIPLFSFTDNLIWKDRNTAANFKKKSDNQGNAPIILNLHYPSKYDFFIIKKGYYPVILSSKTKYKNVILLSKKRFKHKTTGNHSEKIIIYRDHITLPGISYSEMNMNYRNDTDYRLEKAPQDTKQKYINNLNYYNIYKPQNNKDAIFLQEKAKTNQLIDIKHT